MSEVTKARRWYDWYSPTGGPEERNLTAKLDLLIVPYAFILYWLSRNINNAYVSGMSDELNFKRNELVQFQTIFVVGNAVGLLPFIYLFPRVPIHILAPTLDLSWGIFTLMQYCAQSYGEIMAYRFMASYFPGVHFVLGSCHRSDEIGRRGGIFYVGLTLGTLTAGILQSAATTYLDGVHGLAGWRWLFIINAIITLPLALIGYFIWPGTPARPNRLVIKESEISLARSRLEKVGSKVQSTPFSPSLLKHIFTNWRFYIVVLWDIFFFNTSASTAAFLHPDLSILFVLFVNFSVGLWIGRAAAITLGSAINFTGLVILATWNVPEAAKWFAFSVGYSAVAVSSVLYGWANIIMEDNIEERSLTLILRAGIATSTNAWILLLVYHTVEAPRYPKGYVYSTCVVVCLVVMTHIVRILFKDGKQTSAERQPDISEVEEQVDVKPLEGKRVDEGVVVI
ncbi:putative Major facilitator superfamily (MFS) profile domain-containing protein [Seiridium cardinale]|uniref:Major facilitator superfamily (MFS) profile domain-containing protein n=1 Tax=Seiridium cardinale TaxID=138064 RepID=A0ABR2XDB9_9PEZI